MKRIVATLASILMLFVVLNTAFAAQDPMDSAFSRISESSSRKEIETIAKELGLRYHGTHSGTGTYLIRITRESKHSTSNRFSPNNEKQDCIAIELDEWHNDKVKKIEYFNLTRMMSYIYFGEATKYHGIGYHCVDYNSTMVYDYQSSSELTTKVSYQPVSTVDECLSHTGTKRDNANNPLLQLFYRLDANMTWDNILPMINEYKLYFDEESARQSSTYDYRIACAENVSTTSNLHDSGNYLVISVNRKTGELVEVGVYFLESSCRFDLAGHYYTEKSFWPGYYDIQPGYYTYDSSKRNDQNQQYPTAEALIVAMLP